RRADEELQRLSQLEAIWEQAETDARSRQEKEQKLNSKIEDLSPQKEPQAELIHEIEVIEDQTPAPVSVALEDVVKPAEVESDEISWLSIDLNNSSQGNSNSKEIEFVTAETTAD